MVQSMGFGRMKPGGSRPSKPQFPPPHEGLVRPETVGRRARQQQGRDGEELLKKMVPRKGLHRQTAIILILRGIFNLIRGLLHSTATHPSYEPVEAASTRKFVG